MEKKEEKKKKNLQRKNIVTRDQPFAVCPLLVPSLSVRPSFVLHPVASIGTYNLKKPLVNKKERKKRENILRKHEKKTGT
jgi:hypothetical protein